MNDVTSSKLSLLDYLTPSSPAPQTQPDAPKEPSADCSLPVKPKHPGGRPKGSKNRPKWLIRHHQQLRKERRPGRPKGSKNKPKTLAAFVAKSLTVTTEIPPRRPKNLRNPGRSVEHMRRIQKLSTSGHYLRGTPQGWRKKEFILAQEEAKEEAERIYRMLEQEGMVPEDQMAQEALKAALLLLRQPSSNKDKRDIIKIILDHTHAKPASKADVTVRSAEDWLLGLSQEADG